MKVSPVLLHNPAVSNNGLKNNPLKFEVKNLQQLSNTYPQTYYLLNFQARVDKSLDSFVQRNAQTLPYSVKAYVENLSQDDKKTMTPLQAQANAFEYLAICDSVEDIKDAYPEEPLFSELKSVDETKSKRGFLYDIRLMKDDLAQDGETLLENDEDLSVYLVKKIFLEGKTIEEINNDLDNDINPAFKRDDKSYILSSTLKSLGIQLPSVPYLNSLRYTRDGYSDNIGEKISLRWKDMSEEKKSEIIKSHSSRTVSEEERENISKRTKEYWKNLSPQERTEQINKMQQGNHRAKIVAIDAWNNSPEVREALAKYLLENNFYSPQSVIYRTDSYSSAMEIIMNNFWRENPDLAKKLGDNISLGHIRYEQAEANGSLADFENEVYKKQMEAKAEIKKISKEMKVTAETMSPVQKYQSMFSFLPKTLIDKQVMILSKMSNKDVDLWIKYCMGQKLDEKSIEKAQEICEKVAPKYSSEMQCFIAASVTMFEECLAPIYNPKNGKYFNVPFPSNLDFRFPDIARTYFNVRKNGIANIDMLSVNQMSGGKKEDAVKDFQSERFNKMILDKYPNKKFNTSLMDEYEYRFDKDPDFDKLNNIYEYLLNTKISPSEAVMLTNKVLPYNAPSSATEDVVYSVFTNPFLVLGASSDIVSRGMALRGSYGLDGLAKQLGCTHSPLFKQTFRRYEKDFIQFFEV